MALNNVQTTKWAAQIELAAQETAIAAQVANGLYQPDANNAKVISISTFSTPTISTYSGSISYEDLTDGGLDLDMNQYEHYAFKISDIDRAQTVVDLEGAPLDEAARGLALTVDTYAFSQATTGAGTALDDGDFGGTPANALAVNSANVEEVIAEIVETLDVNNAPENRVLILPPFMKQKLVLAGIGRDLMTPETGEIIYREGYIGRYNGLDIFTSNKLVSPAAGEFQALAMTRRALPFAASVTESEVLRLESAFATAYRGLYVFGAGVLFSDEIVSVHVTKAAEA